MAPTNPLPDVHRLITTHREEDGKAIFTSAVSEDLTWAATPSGAAFGLCYATEKTKPDMSAEKDLKTFEGFLTTPPPLIIRGGTVLRYVDMPPLSESPMHRTVSMDYGIVMEGEVEILLDSGEKKLLKKGDVIVQRGTMHQWRNPSSTNWYRMLFILLDSENVEVAGKVLEQEGL